MVNNIEYIKLGITIVTSIISVLGFYHKFIMKKIETVSDDIKIIKEVIIKTHTYKNNI